MVGMVDGTLTTGAAPASVRLSKSTRDCSGRGIDVAGFELVKPGLNPSSPTFSTAGILAPGMRTTVGGKSKGDPVCVANWGWAPRTPILANPRQASARSWKRQTPLGGVLHITAPVPDSTGPASPRSGIGLRISANSGKNLSIGLSDREEAHELAVGAGEIALWTGCLRAHHYILWLLELTDHPL
jgi:hypothetical protein